MVDNDNGCAGCRFLTSSKRCCYGGKDLELLKSGNCGQYTGRGDPNDS